MEIAELRRLKQLEQENQKRKQLVADLTLGKHMLQDILKKKVTPAQQRPMVQYLRSTYGLGIRVRGGLFPWPDRRINTKAERRIIRRYVSVSAIWR